MKFLMACTPKNDLIFKASNNGIISFFPSDAGALCGHSWRGILSVLAESLSMGTHGGGRGKANNTHYYPKSHAGLMV